MTTVSYIHGIPQDEFADRGREVPVQKYINAGAMTDGELKMALLREQLQIFAAFYPEVEAYREGERLIVSVLEQGLHSISYLPPGGPVEVKRAINLARRKNRPAVGALTVPRTSAGLAGLIPTEDCTQYMRQYIDPQDYSGTVTYQHTPESWACEQRNEEVQALNLHLEPSAHHLLYEYVQQPGSQPGSVQTKRVLHRNAISSLAEIMEFDRDNMALWVRNGVIRNNASKGTQPFQPEQTIDIMRTEVPAWRAATGAQVNGPFLAALPAILQAVTAAIVATGTLISVLQAAKQARLRNTAQGIGSRTFGPEAADWEGGPTGGGGATNLLSGDAMPWIIGGAALLLLSDD